MSTEAPAANRTTVVVRAEVSRELGTGHLMRCLALAELWTERGDDVVFAVDELPPALLDRIRDLGSDIEILSSGQPAQSLVELVAARKATALVMDGRSFTDRHRVIARSAGVPVLALDDGLAEALHADVVLNSSPLADPVHYETAAPGARLFLGPAYVPLRREFRSRPRGLSGDRVLVTFGGSDPAGLTAPVAEAVAATWPADVGIDVVLGAAADRSATEAIAARHSGRLTIHVDVRRPSELMSSAALAITAAGSTLWELAYLGVPTIAAAVSPDQDLTLRPPLNAWFATVDGRARPPEEVADQMVIDAWALWTARRRMDERRAQLLDIAVCTDVTKVVDSLAAVGVGR